MRRFTGSFLFGLGLVILSGTSVAAEQLSLQDCIAEALNNNPQIEIAQSRYEAASNRADFTKLQRLPEISTQFSYFHLSDVPPFAVTLPIGTVTISEPVLDVYNAQLAVQQPLFTGFRISSLIEASARTLDAVALQMTGEKADIVLSVTESYFRIVQAIENRDVLKERIDDLNVHLNNVKNYLEAGIATRNDVLQTEVILSSAAIQLNKTESAIVMARVRLAMLLGRESADGLDITMSLPESSKDLPQQSAMIEQALAGRSEPVALTHQYSAAAESRKAVRSALFPSLYAAGTWSYANPNTRYQPLEAEFNDDWSIGLVLRFTPFDWGRTNRQIGEVEAQQRQISAQLSQVRQGIIAQVSDAWEQCREVAGRIDLIDTKIRQADENLRVAQDQFSAGVSTNSDVLDAETALLVVKLEQTEAKIDQLIARARLDRATATGSPQSENTP